MGEISSPGRATCTPPSPLFPVTGRALSPWQPKAPQYLLAASREGSGFKTILHDCVYLSYPSSAPPILSPYTYSCSSPRQASFPTMGSPVAPQWNKSDDAENPIGLESFLPNSCPSGWSGSLKCPPWCPEGMAMAPVPSGCQGSGSCASQLPFPRNFLQAPPPFPGTPSGGWGGL